MGIFEPDIFSKTSPIWNLTKLNKFPELESVIHTNFKILDGREISLYYSGALEINSKNFCISIGENEKFLLKKWSENITNTEVLNLVEIVNYLYSEKCPIAKPLKFNNEEYLIKKKSHYWTISEFIEGEYFSGTASQLDNMPKIICDLTHKLNKLSKKIKPKRGPDYNPFYLINTFKKLKQNKNKIQSIFGDKYSILISNSMDIIEYSINEVNKFKIDSGPVQAIHYDLHPHNLLFRGDQISAIIDYDSILYMPIGYAIAFSSLKLCRQHLALNKQKDSKKIGEKFKQQIHNNLLINTNWIDFFYELSLSEVLRRISIIINLNFQKKTIWNKVLPIQIAHLKEVELLFKN